MPDLAQYYAEKHKHSTRLLKNLSENNLPGQPPVTQILDEFGDVDAERTKKSVTVYIVSVKNRDRNSTAGSVSIAYLDNAARCLTDGTHVIATKEQIEGYKAHQETNRKLAESAEWSSAVKKEVIRETVREVPSKPAVK